jgi:hypothetical protein
VVNAGNILQNPIERTLQPKIKKDRSQLALQTVKNRDEKALTSSILF